MNAETTRSNLNNRTIRIFIEVGMKSVLNSVPKFFAAIASDFCAFKLIEPKDIAENIIGVSSTTCGGISTVDLPFFSTVIFSGFLPRIVLISIGSRSGSMEGFVT